MWFASDFDDSDWLIVTVPHTWNTMPQYAQYNGLGWYRYKLAVPESLRGLHFRLRFQAVFYLAKVWVNGVLIGEHEGGYTPFEFDISPYLNEGQENIVTIKVDNQISPVRIPAKLSEGWSYDWWNYGGIVRPVSLEVSSAIYIPRQEIVAVPNLTGFGTADQAEITSNVIIANKSELSFTGQISYKLMKESTNQVLIDSDQDIQVSVDPGFTTTVKLSTSLTNPDLWHFDHPNLYKLEVTLKNEAGQVHQLESIFGIRTIELIGDQMHLNGEPVRLVGITRHADSPQFGLAESLQIMAADYNDIKLMNEVLSRPVHYPQHEFVLDYADRHGILLIPEIPAWQLSGLQMSMPKMIDLEKQQLSEMIFSEYNHPSVWAWSIGNEIASETPEGHTFVKDMIAYVKSLDPSRPVGFASNRLYSNPENDATALSDFVLMNQYWGGWGGTKQGLSASLDAIHKTWPDKSLIISEFGFEPNWNRLWGPATSTLNSEEYYFIPDGTAPDSDLADEQRRLLIKEQMEILRTKPFISGAIFWTYQDYRTRSGFVMGVVDPERNKRLSWQVLREEFSPVVFDSLNLTDIVEGKRTGIIKLHTRGPIEADMPVYTLRDYNLHWTVASPDGSTVFLEDNIAFPELAPGSEWAGEFNFQIPESDYIISLSIIRPTGFNVIELTSPVY